ncbi:DUF4232 domain-containing protein [Streptomyces glomeratus]|uniref:DUF4232 domain-containing protein n=1 Tax=Streptomyces glomeratus TaxID=284452 RepID=A0ABP6LIM3_9ACTN|nr:DUF4232 domain-containing protein [Streptomyces glomeratus]MCF1510682.1 DUF4232 domain-containing protein [Streptomyces glomeratus]
MVTFRRGTTGPDHDGTAPFPTARRVVSVLGAVAALSLLTACGNDHATSGTPQKLPGTAQPASGDHASEASEATGTDSTAATGSSGSGSTTSAASTGGGTTSGSRCHTSELRASVGPNNPGAGQENFPLVLTNRSGRTCTIDGYPGAAFVDASGKQLGPDPKRSSGHPSKVTLAPGRSAWAGLSFSNPQVSGAKSATPAAILITPPDERASLKVTWRGGPVPVSGNSSASFLTVFQAGTGA